MSHRRTHPRSDDGNAFITDPEGGPLDVRGGVDEELVEDFLRTVTSGQEAGEELRNQTFDEEFGGPFVISTAGQELGRDDDESNPPEAESEAFASAMRGP